METARALSDNLALLLRREQGALGDFLVSLADFDRRRLWIDLGHASLFSYLHRELRLSKAGAQYRKVAAELIQQVPGVVEPLRDGRLCMTSIIEASKVVTAANWERVLPRFFGLSRREAMEVVAELQPRAAPPTRTVVTTARPGPPAPARETVVEPVLPLGAPTELANAQATRGSSDELTHRETVTAPPPPPRPTEVVPLTAKERRLHITVSSRFLGKLQAAKDAHSHSRPGASDEEILEAALDLLIARSEKRKGLVRKPRSAGTSKPTKPGYIPADVKRAVWLRDGGRCQFLLASGGVCGSTRDLELDHITPLARGGASTIENVRIACRQHNLRAARLVLGDELMNRYTRDPARCSPRPGRPHPDGITSA